MRIVRPLSCALVVASLFLLSLPSDANAVPVSGTTELTGGACFSALHCIAVGADASSEGALVSLNKTFTHSHDAGCRTDAATVGIAVAVYQVENPGKYPNTSAGWRAALLGKSKYGPYLRSWPSSPFYAISVAGKAEGRTSGDHVKPTDGDVIVTAVDNGGRTYDATVSPATACANLHVIALVAGNGVGDPSTEDFTGIACPTAATCFGVGSNSGGSEGAVATINVSSPINPTLDVTTSVPGTESLSGIACPTASTCIAVGVSASNQGEVVPIVDGVVGAVVPGFLANGLEGITCLSATLCFAVGHDATVDTGSILTIHVSSSVTVGYGLDVPTALNLDGISCPSPTLCFAVGQGLTSEGATLTVNILPDGNWPSPSTAHSVGGTSELTGVDCIGAGACEVTGVAAAIPTTGVLVGISVRRASSAHVVMGTSRLDAVTCLESWQCVGLGVGVSPVGALATLPPIIGTRTSLRASSYSVTSGGEVALTARVVQAPSSGTVAFSRDGSTISGCGAARVNDGVARCTVRLVAMGTAVLHAAYSGDAEESGSTSGAAIVRVMG